jgi:hypothetical protein
MILLPCAANTTLHCCCIAPQVAFPAELDVYDFCAPELQQQLKAPREAWKNYQDMLAQQKRTAKQLKTEDGPKPGPGAAAAEVAAAGGSSGDVEMRDAEGGAAADSGASSSSVVGALTGGRSCLGPGTQRAAVRRATTIVAAAAA